MRLAKNILSILTGFLLVFSINFSNWAGLIGGSDVPFEHNPEVNPPKCNGEECGGIETWTTAVSNNILNIIKVPQPDSYNTKLWYVLSLVQVSINRLLWILSTVALVYMLYCGFLVFFSGAEDKNASKGKKWIKTATIALAWIGLSWLIISAMIRLITNVAWTD